MSSSKLPAAAVIDGSTDGTKQGGQKAGMGWMDERTSLGVSGQIDLLLVSAGPRERRAARQPGPV